MVNIVVRLIKKSTVDSEVDLQTKTENGKINWYNTKCVWRKYHPELKNK